MSEAIRDSRIASIVIGLETEVSIFSKILHVRFVWTIRKVTSEESGGVEVRAALALLRSRGRLRRIVERLAD